MTSWIEDVVRCIDANSTALTVGTNLFADALPADVATVTVGAFERPGQMRVPVYGETSAFERPVVLVIARSTAPVDGATVPNPTKARNEAWKAYRALNAVVNEAAHVGSTRTFGAIEPNEAPHLMETDDQGRQLYAFTAIAWVRPSTSW